MNLQQRLDRFEWDVINGGATGELDEPRFMRKDAAQAIEADLLALVGEDEPTVSVNGDEYYRSQLRAELRQAIRNYCRGEE